MTDSRPAPAASPSSNDPAAAQCADLLDGIELPPATYAQALAIVRADDAARRTMVEHARHRFWDQIAMIAERDAAIRLLLQTDEQRARYDANVARWNRIRAG